jgi:hypothetical protein
MGAKSRFAQLNSHDWWGDKYGPHKWKCIRQYKFFNIAKADLNEQTKMKCPYCDRPFIKLIAKELYV